MSVYDVNGTRIDSGGGGTTNYDVNVISVNHRGYNSIAPENTLPAFKQSKQNGFNYVETDVQFTSDGVAVLLHDKSINRTARNSDGSSISGTVNISDITYEQALTYDFGIWKSPMYKGTKIPTLHEFLYLCKTIMLSPYIELKSDGGYTQAQINSIVDAVDACGMKGKVTYISFNSTYLGYVKTKDAEARLGFLSNTATSSELSVVQGLKTTSNEVYFGANYTSLSSSACALFVSAGIPIEAWTVNTADAINALDASVSGVTSDILIAGKVLYETNLA